MSIFSTFLFARPSFSEGFGRVLDFGNTLQEYNQSLTEQQADIRALMSDWSSVAAHLNAAIESTMREQGLSRVQKIGKTETAAS